MFSSISQTTPPFPFISPISCYSPILSSFFTHFLKNLPTSVVTPGYILTSEDFKLGTINKKTWQPMEADESEKAFVSLCWTDFTWYNAFQFFPFTWKFHDFTLLYSWLVPQVCVYPIFIIQLSVEGQLAVSISQLLWREPQRTMLSRCLWSRVLGPLGICWGVI